MIVIASGAKQSLATAPKKSIDSDISYIPVDRETVNMKKGTIKDPMNIMACYVTEDGKVIGQQFDIPKEIPICGRK